jgi:predicted permease
MPGYFTAMRTELVEGREFTPQDRPGSSPVMMITEGMARLHWPAQSALGQRIVLSSGAREIVGVVRDAHEFGPEDAIPPVMFVPATQRLARGLSFVVRTAGDPLATAEGVQEVARRVTPGQPVYFVQSMEQLVEEEMSGETVMGKLLGVFGALALLLAVIGVYGVMAYSVSQRTQEMGIRRALGAPDPAILRLVLRQGALLAGIGNVVGLALAAGATRGLATFLYGVSPFDLAIFGGVTMALGAAALAACVIPARRATRVDPIIALRAE